MLLSLVVVDKQFFLTTNTALKAPPRRVILRKIPLYYAIFIYGLYVQKILKGL